MTLRTLDKKPDSAHNGAPVEQIRANLHLLGVGAGQRAAAGLRKTLEPIAASLELSETIAQILPGKMCGVLAL
jgi:hypothetical protein